MRRLLPVFVLALCSSAAAQEEGGWRFKVGACDRYASTSSMESMQKLNSRRGTSSSKTISHFTQTVEAVSGTGTATLLIRFERIQFKASGGGKSLEVDTDDERSRDSARAHPDLKSFVDLVGKELRVKVTRKGRVISARPVQRGDRNKRYGSSGEWQALWLQWPRTEPKLNERWSTSYTAYPAWAKLVFDDRHQLTRKTGERWTVKSQLKAEVDIVKPYELRNARVSVTKAEGTQTSEVVPTQGRLESLDQRFQVDCTMSMGRGSRRVWLTQEITVRYQVKRLGAGEAKPASDAQPKEPKAAPKPTPKPAKPAPPPAATIARYVKALGTVSPSKTKDPEGWKRAREQRKRAAFALRKIGAPALPALREAAQDPANKTLRQWAAYVIKKIEGAPAR